MNARPIVRAQRYFLLATLLTSLALPADGTLCSPITLSDSYTAAQVVFRGRAVEIIPADMGKGTSVTNRDGTTTTFYDTPMKETVKFEVLETFKGNVSGEIKLTAGIGNFHPGEESIVFASPNSATHELETGVCSGNRYRQSPTYQADLAWLRAHTATPPIGSAQQRPAKE